LFLPVLRRVFFDFIRFLWVVVDLVVVLGFVSFVFVFLVVGCHVCVVWFWWWFLVLRRGWVSGVGGGYVVHL